MREQAQTESAEQMTLFDIGEPDPEFPHVAPDDLVPGSVWRLSRHTLAMLDATDPASYARLRSLGALGETGADVVFADPPYGMGFASDGVDNDNQTTIQMREFSRTWVPLSVEALGAKGSWLCWGSDLSTLEIWVTVHPLVDAKTLYFRNLLTWKKSNAPGVNSQVRSFNVTTENCLFLVKGWPSFNGTEWFCDSFEPLRQHLIALVEKAGGAKAANDALGSQMVGHYTGKSEWTFPTEEAYRKLATAAGIDNEKAKADYEKAKAVREKEFPYFNNTADFLTDVIVSPITTPAERKAAHNFPTVKPQALIRKILKAVTPPGGLVLDPFCGSGSTLIACEVLKRRCTTLEVNPRNAAICIDRWEKLTGKEAERTQ